LTRPCRWPSGRRGAALPGRRERDSEYEPADRKRRYDRLARRLRAGRERLEAVEDALDQVTRELAELRRGAPPPTLGASTKRLAGAVDERFHFDFPAFARSVGPRIRMRSPSKRCPRHHTPPVGNPEARPGGGTAWRPPSRWPRHRVSARRRRALGVGPLWSGSRHRQRSVVTIRDGAASGGSPAARPAVRSGSGSAQMRGAQRPAVTPVLGERVGRQPMMDLTR